MHLMPLNDGIGGGVTVDDNMFLCAGCTDWACSSKSIFYRKGISIQ